MHIMWPICIEKVFCLHTSNECVITLNLHSEGYGQNYYGCGQIDSDSTSSNWKIIKLAGNRFICMFCTSFKWFKCRFCHAYHLQNKSNTSLTLHNSLKNVVNDELSKNHVYLVHELETVNSVSHCTEKCVNLFKELKMM